MVLFSPHSFLSTSGACLIASDVKSHNISDNICPSGQIKIKTAAWIALIVNSSQLLSIYWCVIIQTTHGLPLLAKIRVLPTDTVNIMRKISNYTINQQVNDNKFQFLLFRVQKSEKLVNLTSAG